MPGIRSAPVPLEAEPQQAQALATWDRHSFTVSGVCSRLPAIGRLQSSTQLFIGSTVTQGSALSQNTVLADVTNQAPARPAKSAKVTYSSRMKQRASCSPSDDMLLQHTITTETLANKRPGSAAATTVKSWPKQVRFSRQQDQTQQSCGQPSSTVSLPPQLLPTPLQSASADRSALPAAPAAWLDLGPSQPRVSSRLPTDQRSPEHADQGSSPGQTLPSPTIPANLSPTDLLPSWSNPCLQSTSGSNIADLPTLCGAACERILPTAISRTDLQQGDAMRQFEKKFIAFVCSGVLCVADQHAADERVQLERLKAAVLAGRVCS